MEINQSSQHVELVLESEQQSLKGAAAPTNEACPTDETTPSENNVKEILRQLAELSPLEYESVRIEKAKQLGFRTQVLDTEVKKLQNSGADASHLPFATIEAAAEPVNPAVLLEEIVGTIKRYIVLDDEQAVASALWVAHTWFIDHLEISPLAIINAPEKACGKTQLLTLFGYLSNKPLLAANASTSSIFRAVEKWMPTILVDEADTFFKENSELQGLVNAGYLRGSFILRTESTGVDFEPRKYSIFSAKAIAGIALEKHLPDATVSRGIIINLRRKKSEESVSRLRHAEYKLFGGIAAKLARFAEDYAQRVKLARPTLPESLSDREQDNWEPLIAIATCAGDEWIKKATEAALKLSQTGEVSVSTGNQLLADIYEIFLIKRSDKISTAELIQTLIEDDEKPWSTYNRGKPITPRQIAKHLSSYGISSKTVRLGPYKTPKGFEKSQFDDAFARYIDTAHQANFPQQSNEYDIY